MECGKRAGEGGIDRASIEDHAPFLYLSFPPSLALRTHPRWGNHPSRPAATKPSPSARADRSNQLLQ